MAAAPRNILVLGLGELGLPVTVHIAHAAAAREVAKPVSVSVLQRPETISNPSAAKAKDQALVQSLNVSLVPGDLSSPKEDLIKIFALYDCVVNCTGFVGGSENLLKTVQAVLDAKVSTFIPWQFGVDYDEVGYGSAQKLWDTQLDVRNMLREHTAKAGNERTRWTIVQTGIFTSFLFEPWFGVVGMSPPTVRALGAWENRVSTTSPNDIGQVTAVAVFDPSLRDKIVKCAGDTISYSQLADIMGGVLVGSEVRKEVLDLDFLQQELRDAPEDNVKMYQVAFAKGVGCSWDLEETINHQRGLKLQTVAEFAKGKFGNGNT